MSESDSSLSLSICYVKVSPMSAMQQTITYEASSVPSTTLRDVSFLSSLEHSSETYTATNPIEFGIVHDLLIIFDSCFPLRGAAGFL